MNTTITTCFIIFALFFIAEKLAPARKLKSVSTWCKRVLLINAIQVTIIIFAGMTWDKLFMSASLFKISVYLPTSVTSVIAYFFITFVFYWWHRARHEYNFFWLTCHQLHHSPERLETITSFYKHPLEIAINSIMISAICYGFFGLTQEAASLTLILTAVGEYFYHANIRTPYWLGFFIQRPEMHRVHHEMGSHHYNYSDLPLWDMLFGTFKNPKEDTVPCGFEDNKEQELLSMLTFKDVFKRSTLKGEFKYIAVVSIGLIQMFGYLTGQENIKGLGTLSVSSPLPIVFTKFNGNETFSQKYYLKYTTDTGEIIEKEISKHDFEKMRAPYNLRNVYGYAMAYGPSVKKEKMLIARNEILNFAFCNNTSSMKKIGSGSIKDWQISVYSKAQNSKTLELEGSCKQ